VRDSGGTDSLVEYAGKWTYAIDLPIEDGKFPTGEKLEEVIQSMAPVWLIERKNALEIANNAHEIEALVQPLPVTLPTPAEPAIPANTVNASDIAFINQLIDDALSAKGL